VRPFPTSDDEDRGMLKNVCFRRSLLLHRRSDLITARTNGSLKPLSYHVKYTFV
jgi:hypothetical protein